MKTLFKNAEIITMDEETGDIKDGHVLVEDDRILYVGAFPPYCPDCGRTVECRGKVLMPGLVNAHCHLPMTLLRGYAEELPLDKWLYGRIFPAETRMTAERAYRGALLGMAEMISTGTVAVTDMYFMGESGARAAGEAGIRANITHTLTCPDEDFDFSKHEGVRRADALFESCNGLFDGRVTVEYEIHALYTANERFVRRCLPKRSPHLNKRAQLHLSETRAGGGAQTLRSYGRTPVRVFHDAGAFRNSCVAAH